MRQDHSKVKMFSFLTILLFQGICIPIYENGIPNLIGICSHYQQYSELCGLVIDNYVFHILKSETIQFRYLHKQWNNKKWVHSNKHFEIEQKLMLHLFIYLTKLKNRTRIKHRKINLINIIIKS